MQIFSFESEVCPTIPRNDPPRPNACGDCGLISKILIAIYPSRYITHSDSEADLDAVCYVYLTNAKNQVISTYKVL